MWEITAVISGFLLAIGTILVVTGANIPLGLGLMAVGAVGLAASVMANWNGMSERLAKVLTLVTGVLGGFLLAIGAFLVFRVSMYRSVLVSWWLVRRLSVLRL